MSDNCGTTTCEESTNVTRDFSSHPCFNVEAKSKFGRAHLPVAPRCNIQCNFCNRKFDCVNESRPGVTSTILTPEQAAAYFDLILEKKPGISVAGIAGPGDPFANPDETMETLRLVRQRHPESLLCVASNGVDILPYVDELARLEVSHLTLTMNAIDPKISSQVYAWVRKDKRVYRGVAAGEVMVAAQKEALKALKAAGIVVKINSIIIPGVNDHHIPEIAAYVAEMGADMQNCMPLIPTAGTPFEELPQPSGEMVARVRLHSGAKISQMTHCARCRADAIGLIDQKMSPEDLDLLSRAGQGQLEPDNTRPYVAAASIEGLLVNQHLGEAARFVIFQEDSSTESGFKFVEIRKAPVPGGGGERWKMLGDTLNDCRAILVNAAGPSPTLTLKRAGIQVIEMEGMIEDGLRHVFKKEALPAAARRKFSGCSSGSSCRGTGTGCG